MHLYIVSHKFCSLPTRKGYYPLFVGASKLGKLSRDRDWSYDDLGLDNISDLNPYYCELTGAYQIWKHCEDDIVGLCHYRRFLGEKDGANGYSPLSAETVADDLERYDCLVANREFIQFDGYAASIAEHYRRCHVSTDLILARFAIARLSPSYLRAFDKVVARTWLYPCNIIVCKKELFDDFCAWLFPIERDLLRKIDISKRDSYQKRAFGFLSERLLNVFLAKHQLACKEYPLFDPKNPSIEQKNLWGSESLKRPHVYDSDGGGWHPVYNGRSYEDVFDFCFYINHNADLFQPFSTNPQGALEHFVQYGAMEGRIASRYFNIDSYINGNPMLREKYGESPSIDYVIHYLDNHADRRRAIGFENIRLLGKEKEPVQIGFLSKLKTYFQDSELIKAERYGVLD